jgi:xanthine dehydrogenase large subunit
LDATFYGDVGATPNDMTSIYAVEHMQNVYKAVGWELKAGFLLTNTPSNTTFRAPGSLKGIALIEYIMEHIAHKLNKDPWTVREANFISKGDPLIPIFDAEAPFDTENLIPTLMTELHASANYAQRKLLIEKFNQVIAAF